LWRSQDSDQNSVFAVAFAAAAARVCTRAYGDKTVPDRSVPVGHRLLRWEVQDDAASASA
jgi:hypothetical protein